MTFRSFKTLLLGLGLGVAGSLSATAAQQPVPPSHREFRPGSVSRSEDLPAGRLRSRIESLSPGARAKAVAWLGAVHFSELDLETLHADPEGGIYYADPVDPETVPAVSATEPTVEAAAVPVSPFPAGLKFHSRPGAPNVLFLNFAGETVTGTQWNSAAGQAAFVAVAFSSDADLTTFSDSEQAVIKRVWQRVAEDYAPFNIDVTTERPASFNSRTAMALITRSTDANGVSNPSSSSGGVAYLNVFAGGSYASYRPAWIYADNLGHNEAFIAEAASHEIGHNLGLSHDGKTDGSGYYGGHGSGETSWGPLMGTGYNRNVSQWSKGDYHLANNTQDDLALIAGKISYRADDHGNTTAAATALVLSGGTNIVSTTPETDPTNAMPANKGVIERNTDADLFSFVTGPGTISLAVNPWVSPANTRGDNLDLQLDLYDGSGTLVVSTNPPSQTGARITATLAEGLYHLRVSPVGAGDPLGSTPTGYTAYGSLGQYFVSGHVVPSGYVAPPQAEAQLTDLTQSGVSAHPFTVTYTDNLAVDVSSLDSADIRITGPNGYDQLASLVGVDDPANGTPRMATYSAPAPNGGVWSPADDGDYEVRLADGAVADTEGAAAAGKLLGQFAVAIPNAVYFANMDTDPGWSFAGQWAYGSPNYTGTAPTAGYTGSKIIGYNLSGNYANNLATTYATTPQIDCGNATSLTLRFRRWLRLNNRDSARVQVSTNGTSWTSLWTTSSSVSDGSWQEIQYALPDWTAGSRTVQIRWGIGSNNSGSGIGWNLDDVEILSGGALDTAAPVAVLGAADVATGGSPSHSFSVTYSDASAVAVSTLGDGDLLVTGPNGYSNLVEFAGVDTLPDGSPRTASYSVAAPDGPWDRADNGVYEITLLEGAVSDIYNNPVPETALGSFLVAIPEPAPTLVVTPSVLTIPEGSNAIVHITLSAMPASPVAVVVAHASGSPHLAVASGATNLLDSSNWSTGVAVELAALPDPDQADDEAIFGVSAAGLAPVSIFATAQDTTPDYTVIASVNNADWGAVTPESGAFAFGTEAAFTAEAKPFHEFTGWSGDVSGTENPLTVTVVSNLAIRAEFAELTTTNHPTPLWWLAAHGLTNDLENAVDQPGANGRPYWESFVAGLDPLDPESQLRLRSAWNMDTRQIVLSWDAVTGRVYTVWSGTHVSGIVNAVSNGASLTVPDHSLTNPIPTGDPAGFFRLGVAIP